MCCFTEQYRPEIGRVTVKVGSLPPPAFLPTLKQLNSKGVMWHGSYALYRAISVITAGDSKRKEEKDIFARRNSQCALFVF